MTQRVRLIDGNTGQVEETRITFGHANENARAVWVCRCGCSDFQIVPATIERQPEIVCKDCRAPQYGWF